MADDTNKAEQERRKAAGEALKKASEESRRSSEETLAEQGGMKPVPSQDEADAIKADVVEEREEVGQPDGPAARAAAGKPDVLHRALGAEEPAKEYKTRQAPPPPPPPPSRKSE
jgi:hypothetical protein